MKKILYDSLQTLHHNTYQNNLNFFGGAFIIRHAERTALKTIEDVILADLTPKGWKDAEKFGKELSKTFILEAIYCSPILRCIHTAQAVLSGYGLHLPIQQRWWLFSPFLAPKQHNLQAENITICSHSEEKEKAISIIDARKLRLLLQRIHLPKVAYHLTLYITHDSTIAPLAAFLLNRNQVSVDEYPAYMTGLWLNKQIIQPYLL